MRALSALRPLPASPSRSRQPTGPFLKFFKNHLHFSVTLLKKNRILFGIHSGFFAVKPVPLGRFYSSRPSSRSQFEIVLE
jgi:hypothetical protein